MRKNQENKFTMYKAVDTYLDENHRFNKAEDLIRMKILSET